MALPEELCEDPSLSPSASIDPEPAVDALRGLGVTVNVVDTATMSRLVRQSLGIPVPDPDAARVGLAPLPLTRRRSVSTAPSSAPSMVRTGTSSTSRDTASPETAADDEEARQEDQPISRKHERTDEDLDFESSTT